MRTIHVHAPGGPEVLQVDEVADPTPGAGEVVVRTTAIGVNFADLWVRLTGGESLPVTPGIEAAGTVAALGEGVEGLAVGQRVIGAPLYQRGAYAELIVVPATHVLPLPDDVSDTDAASLTLNYGTAYAALYNAGRVEKGETALIHAAAGGVGLAAVQLAQLREATVIGTASAGKHDFLRAQGVGELVDYRTGDWTEAVRALRPDGVDVVLDSIGEDGFGKSLSVLGYGGRVVAYGFSSAMGEGESDTPGDVDAAMAASPVTVDKLFNNSVGIVGCHLGAPAPLFRRWMTWIIERTAAGDLRPHVDREFALEDVAEAHRYIHERRNVGKVLLIP